MNDLWKEEPDSEGVWWCVNPEKEFEHLFMVAKVFPEGGKMSPRLRIHLAGDRRDHPVDHFRGVLVWQKAIMPIYRWPSPDHSH